MNDLLKDQVCLVTGATRGIGKAIACALIEQGGIVYGTATSENGASAIAQNFKRVEGDGHGHGHGRVLDVTDARGAGNLITEITEQSGAPLVLVNNAGITRDNLVLRMKESEWDEIMDTNLKSVYTLSKACLRGMTKARFGRIINISSVVGATGSAGQANYAAAKAGLIGFSKSLAREVASRNITVNAIAPGFIQTDMTNALSEDQRQAIMKNIPMAKLGSPEDIAAAAVFLASSAANYITGTTLHVNGGMFMV
ncbi:3-oxoacyl-ACP reductase FabG [Candidatus Spongiihabitans sp.]|uniref:3-oxoacyl-ACP reductase FabG n=1 Tax=Candidatus Spongiihabitans sp. TaxID=3101308 RepID=UPI003C7A438F